VTVPRGINSRPGIGAGFVSAFAVKKLPPRRVTAGARIQGYHIPFLFKLECAKMVINFKLRTGGEP